MDNFVSDLQFVNFREKVTKDFATCCVSGGTT